MDQMEHVGGLSTLPDLTSFCGCEVGKEIFLAYAKIFILDEQGTEEEKKLASKFIKHKDECPSCQNLADQTVRGYENTQYGCEVKED